MSQLLLSRAPISSDQDGRPQGRSRSLMSLSTWSAFRAQRDLLSISHRGLQLDLIPGWLSSPHSLNDRIESSAYGETPPELIRRVLDLLAARTGERLLDLGCGGGNVCAQARDRGLRVLGIERNPRLLAEARRFFDGHPEVQLEEGDFLEHGWDDVHLTYATTARFPAGLLHSLARKIDGSPPLLRAAACLGRPLPLPSVSWREESHGKHQVTWNLGEATLDERLFLYRRF